MNGIVGLLIALWTICIYTRQCNNAEPLTNPGNRKMQATRNSERPLLKNKKEHAGDAQPSVQDTHAQRMSHLTSTIASRPTAVQSALYPILLFSDTDMPVFHFHLSLPAAPAPQF